MKHRTDTRNAGGGAKEGSEEVPQTKLTLRVDLAPGGATIHYSSTGRVPGLLTGDVANYMYQASRPTESGSRAWWEDVLTQVLADITAGNGGGS